MQAFAAIDFETANHSPDSACAVGIVVVWGSRIVRRAHHLIRPPTKDFFFTYLHGLTWQDVRNAPSFAEVWRQCKHLIREVEFMAAHNAEFGLGVLDACCTRYGLRCPELPFVCTVQVARQVWDIYPTKLPMFAGIWGFHCAIMKLPRMRRRVRGSSSLLARPAGGRN